MVAHFVPGSLLLGVLALIPHELNLSLPWFNNDLLGLVAAFPAAYATGQVMQGISSLAEPIYYRLWGGRPSDRLMAGSYSRFAGERLARAQAQLLVYFHTADLSTPADRADLFQDAMALCNKENLGRVESFNAAYALHRALLTTGVVAAILLAVPTILVVVQSGPSHASGLGYLLVLALGLSAVEFLRARQRGEYFSSEVLGMAYLYALQSASNPSPEASP